MIKNDKYWQVCVECGGELELEYGCLGIDTVRVCENFGFFRRHHRKIPREIYEKYLKYQTESLKKRRLK